VAAKQVSTLDDRCAKGLKDDVVDPGERECMHWRTFGSIQALACVLGRLACRL